LCQEFDALDNSHARFEYIVEIYEVTYSSLILVDYSKSATYQSAEVLSVIGALAFHIYDPKYPLYSYLSYSFKHSMTDERLSAFLTVIGVFKLTYTVSLLDTDHPSQLISSGQLESLDMVSVAMLKINSRQLFSTI
jgi:hypothetical protein